MHMPLEVLSCWGPGFPSTPPVPVPSSIGDLGGVQQARFSLPWVTISGCDWEEAALGPGSGIGTRMHLLPRLASSLLWGAKRLV